MEICRRSEFYPCGEGPAAQPREAAAREVVIRMLFPARVIDAPFFYAIVSEVSLAPLEARSIKYDLT